MVTFTVEAAGEANPLNEAALERVLRAASSRDVIQIQSGTKQLLAWETESGYYTLLQKTFLQRSLPAEVRMLSLIQFKNGIDKYWRRSAANAIRAAERTTIRGQLLQGTLDEPVDRLASLSAIATAKIARSEYPGQWQNLMKEVNAMLRQSAGPEIPSSRLLRALLITHHIVKELATVRLTRIRAAFLAAAPELLATLQEVYFFKLQQWQGNLSSSLSGEIMQDMRVTEQTLKVIRRLIVAGYDFPHRHDEVKEFWASTDDHVQIYFQVHHQEHLQNAYRISAFQHAKQLGKMHLTMAKDNPVSFALLPKTPDLVRMYWSTAKEFRQRQLSAEDDIDDDQVDVYDSFNLCAVLILRASFKEGFNQMQSFKYRNAEGKDEPPRARQILMNDLLTHDFVRGIFETLISNFFLYVQSDIEEWITEPEEWDLKEEGSEEAYEKSIRAASERLFLDITIHRKDIVIQPLLEIFHSIANNESAQPLMKDAVYSAIGVAAPILSGKLDFNNFIRTSLVADLRQQEPMFSVVRRRIAILLARWIPVDIAEDQRPLVYLVYESLLDARDALNNQAVRITAGKRLRDVVDELAFSPTSFSPHAATIMSRLLDLISEVNLPETKLSLLNTLSIIVSRMANEVNPFADQLVGILQNLWIESGVENMMKAAIVNVLRKLVRSMGRASVRLHPMMLQTIAATVEPGSMLQVYLLEDALDLWIAILEQTSAPATEDFLALVQYIPPIVKDEDHSQRALRIARSYVLLSPPTMLQDSARDLFFSSFHDLLDVKQTSIIDNMTGVVELMIRSAEGIGAEQAVQIVTQSLVATGFANKMMESIHLQWQRNQSTGPTRNSPPHDWKNETSYFAILARIILPSTQSFLFIVNQFANTKSLDLEVMMPSYLEECFRHMDSIAQATDKKLICMSLTKLLETGQPWILNRLQDLMFLWTSMVTELQDTDAEKGNDTLVYTQPSEQDVSEKPESDRNSAVMYADPVHTINLGQYIRHHLQQAIARSGGEQRFQEQCLINVDKDVIKAFGELGIM